MKAPRLMRVVAAMIALLSLNTMALPQSFSGTVTGRVLDQQGAVIPTATLTLKNTETGIERVITADEEGNYQFISISPGQYSLTVEKEGFSQSKINIEVSVAGQARADITLQVGNLKEQQVLIAAEGSSAEKAPSLQVCCGGELSSVVTRRQVIELPLLTRDIYELVSLSPGAAPTSEGRGIGLAVNGQRSSSGNYVLDGGENNNVFFAGPAQNIPVDSIREFRVITNNYTAEYGRSAGFIANIVSSTGTNEFHGSVYDFNRNSALAANSFDNNANNLDKAVFNRHQFGGTIGGPIKKDKLFLFGTVEPTTVRSQGARQFFVPTPQLIAISSPITKAIFARFPVPQELLDQATDIRTLTLTPFNGNTPTTIPAYAQVSKTGPINAGAGLPQDSILASFRLDYNLSQQTQIFGRYSLDNRDIFAPLFQPYSDALDQGFTARSQNFLLNLVRTWSARFVTESRVIYGRALDEGQATPEGESFPQFSVFDSILGRNPVLPFGSNPFGGVQNLYQFYQTASMVRGGHLFKFGGQYIHLRDNRIGVGLGQLGRAFFPGDQALVDGDAFVLIPFDAKGKVADENVQPPVGLPSIKRHFRYNEFSFFIQDSWRLNSRLTLSPGLRYEYFGVLHSSGHERALDSNFYYGPGGTPFERISNGEFLLTSEAPGKYKNHFYLPDYKNVAPRFGLAYDILGDGSTVFRSGVGVFYDRTFGNVLSNVSRNPPGYAEAQFLVNRLSPEFLTNPFVVVGNNPITLNSVSGRHLDQNLKSAYTVSWNAGVEHLVNGFLLTGITYVGASGNRLYSISNINRVNSGRFLPGGHVSDDPFTDPNRLVEGVANLNTRGNLGHSSYHSMQLRVESRNIASLGLQFGANYTWSHSIDNASSAFSDDFVANPIGIGFLDAFNPSLDRGDSDFDTRHRLVANFVWDIPYGRNSEKWYIKHLLAGWGMSGVLTFQSGQPFSIFDRSDPEFQVDRTDSPRPRFSGSAAGTTLIPDATRFNTFLFLPLNNTFNANGECELSRRPFTCSASFGEPLDGTISRNTFRRPGTQYHNMAILRNFAIPKIFGREGARLQLRAEFYNVFNHANLYVNEGTNDVGVFGFSPSAGRFKPGVTVRRGNAIDPETLGLPSFIDNRQIVIAAKLIF